MWLMVNKNEKMKTVKMSLCMHCPPGPKKIAVVEEAVN